MVSEEIAQGDVQAVNYFVAQKYVEALQTIVSTPNQRFVFLPLESSGVIGAMAELARQAMGKGAS